MTMNGTMIATAVFGLLLTAAPRIGHADDGKATKDKQEASVRCEGINRCKGQSASENVALSSRMARPVDPIARV